MATRANKYRITLEQVSLLKEDAVPVNPIQLEFENHDDIFRIVDLMRTKNLFGDENQSIEFAIGLRLFSEVLLKNRELPLFRDFMPAFGDFMKQLKR